MLTCSYRQACRDKLHGEDAAVLARSPDSDSDAEWRTKREKEREQDSSTSQWNDHMNVLQYIHE